VQVAAAAAAAAGAGGRAAAAAAAAAAVDSGRGAGVTRVVSYDSRRRASHERVPSDHRLRLPQGEEALQDAAAGPRQASLAGSWRSAHARPSAAAAAAASSLAAAAAGSHRSLRARRVSMASSPVAPEPSPASAKDAAADGADDAEQKCCGCHRAPPPELPRQVAVNAPAKEFGNNYISTAKYSLLTFLPRALFEQCVCGGEGERRGQAAARRR
jgi:hypothetical protein